MNEGQNGIFSGLANSDASNQSNFGLQTNNPATSQPNFTPQTSNTAGGQPNPGLPPSNIATSQPNFTPQSPVVAPSGGDIILGGKDSRKSHKWLIFLILGVVLVAAVAIIIVILNTKNLTSKTSSADLAGLVNYIENGPDGAIENTGESSKTSSETSDEADGETDTELADVIYAIRVKDNPRSVIEAYYNELNKKADDALSELSDGTAMEYRSALRILEYAINYKAVSEKAIEIAKTGLNNAKTYFEENFDCTDAAEGLASLCQTEARYYEDVIGEYFLYADNGCYQTDGSYDLECLNNISEDLESSIESPDEARAKMSSPATLKVLSNQIKTLNQKLLEEDGNV